MHTSSSNHVEAHRVDEAHSSACLEEVMSRKGQCERAYGGREHGEVELASERSGALDDSKTRASSGRNGHTSLARTAARRSDAPVE